MERLGGFKAVLVTATWLCFDASPCKAQLPDPAAQATAPAPSLPSSPMNSVPREHGSSGPTTPRQIPPPRPWSVRRAPKTGEITSPLLAAGSSTLDRTVSESTQNTPQPRPATPEPAIPPPASIDQMAVAIKPAPLEPQDFRFPINLATALRLADARPLIVAAAQASVWVAEAQLTRAKLLWVPSLMIGADYIRHDGGGPDINKGVMTADSANFFYAGPGLWQMVSLTDAYFEPLAARQVLNARHWKIQAAKNDSLMMTADAYFKVHQYRGQYAGTLYAVERGHDLVERIENLSRELVPRDEVDRARNMVADLQQQATQAREAWRVSSADLTQVLRLDPRAVVVPLEHDHLQVTLIDPAMPLPDLHRLAMANRPELASQRAEVQAAEIRVRREKNRLLLPTVMVNGFQSAGMYIQAGIFGLGPNSTLNNFVGRSDVSLQLMWQFEGLGIGNLARIKSQRGEESRAIIDLYHAQDHVVAEVTGAQAHVQSAAARVLQADRALRTAIITFNGNFEGLRQTTRFGGVLVLVNRPQEAVYALELLKLSLDDYFSTVADYNRAEFDLFHAVGYPAAELAYRQPPGDVVPVDTNRPAYLPRVGNGPPPATD